MIRMNVNRILPLMLLLVLFASCSRKYKVVGVSSVTSLGARFVLNEWPVRLCNDGDALHE